MPFAYYDRLSRRDQAVYRRSDAIPALPLPRARDLAPAVEALGVALARDNARAVATSAAELAGRIARELGAPAPVVQVLAVRPSHGWGELHGLYTQKEEVALIRATEGFFRRESSLFRQLVPPATDPQRARAPAGP